MLIAICLMGSWPAYSAKTTDTLTGPQAESPSAEQTILAIPETRALVIAAAALVLSSLVILLWNHRFSTSVLRRRQANKRLIDMTDKLKTGLFQFRYQNGREPNIEFANKTAKQWAGMLNNEIDSLFDSPFISYIADDDRDRILQQARGRASAD